MSYIKREACFNEQDFNEQERNRSATNVCVGRARDASRSISGGRYTASWANSIVKIERRTVHSARDTEADLTGGDCISKEGLLRRRRERDVGNNVAQ
jgi:hypothetical protein